MTIVIYLDSLSPVSVFLFCPVSHFSDNETARKGQKSTIKSLKTHIFPPEPVESLQPLPQPPAESVLSPPPTHLSLATALKSNAFPYYILNFSVRLFVVR